MQQTHAMLAAEVPPSVAAARPTVDLATSDAPFVIIYDVEHSVLSSSASISGSVPHLPPGVLDEASARGEDRVTWQPAAAVREAVTGGRWQSATACGVVVAGVSLAATEDRTAMLRNWVGLAWLLVELALTATLTVAAGSVPARSTQSATIAPSTIGAALKFRIECTLLPGVARPLVPRPNGASYSRDPGGSAPHSSAARRLRHPTVSVD